MNTLKKFNERYAQLIAEQANSSAEDKDKFVTVGFDKKDNENSTFFTKQYDNATVTIIEMDYEFRILVDIPDVGQLHYPRISRGHYFGGRVNEVVPKFIEEIDADLNNEDAPAMVSKCAPTLTALKADLQKAAK